jgi:cellobiose-specific phosphotransferase system component IIA
VDTWLLVFAGSADWQAVIARGVNEIQPAHAEAHQLLSQEISPRGGERWNLLLVHRSLLECDELLRFLEPL